MPPSGYNLRQAKAICSFLGNCSEELENECKIFKRTEIQGLEKECGDIERELISNELAPTVAATLNLTLSFYREVLAIMKYDDIEYNVAVVKSLDSITEKILDVHIEQVAI